MFIQNWEREERLRRLRASEAARLTRERLLEREVAMPDLPPTPGVYEEEIHPPGEHWYKIVMPSGRVGIVHFPDELCDAALLPNLWRRFHAKSERLLKII